MEKTGNRRLYIALGVLSFVFIFILVLLLAVLKQARQQGDVSSYPVSSKKDRKIGVFKGREGTREIKEKEKEIEEKELGEEETSPVVKDRFFPPVSSPPKLIAENWDIKVDKVKVPPLERRGVPSTSMPQSVRIYTLKQDFSEEEVSKLARFLGFLTPVKKEGDFLFYKNSHIKQRRVELLLFNKETGSFTYISTLGKKLNFQDIKSSIFSFLKNSGLYDSSLDITASYKKKSEPGITFYELHRDWKKTGLPVLNKIGLLNIPERDKLSQISLYKSVSNLPIDTDIYATSDEKDGLARQDDFNTMTLAVDDQSGVILSINSNLRFAEESVFEEEAGLIGYSEAKEKLKNNRPDFVLTVPAGEGSVSFDKVFPQNKARAKTVIIDEAILAYLENPPNVLQKKLLPYYIFRGYADLESGYRARVIAGVIALGNRKDFSIDFGVRTVYAQDRKDTETTSGEAAGVQQGTFTFPTLSPTPTRPPTPTSSGQSSECYPSVDNLDPIYETSDGVRFGFFIRYGYWYYIPSEGATVDNLLSALESFKREVEEMRNIAGPGYYFIRPRIDLAIQEFERKGGKCPVRITGGSPSLFIYGKKGKAFQVKVLHPLTYKDPALSKDKDWKVVVDGRGGVVVNGVKRDYIYYEYQPVGFSRPTKGWVIERKDLYNLAKLLSRRLNLNRKEEERLYKEIYLASKDIEKGNRLFVGLIPQKEVDQKLPLRVNPLPAKIYRLHFYVGKPVGENKILKPNLRPIDRTRSLFIEIGALADN